MDQNLLTAMGTGEHHFRDGSELFPKDSKLPFLPSSQRTKQVMFCTVSHCVL